MSVQRLAHLVRARRIAVVVFEQVHPPRRELGGICGFKAQRAGEAAAGGRARVSIDTKLQACQLQPLCFTLLQRVGDCVRSGPFGKGLPLACM